MKALEKDRTRRYDTVSAFRLDVEKFMEGEPVSAVPPSSIYVLQKMARKHRTALLTSVAFAFLLVASTIGLGVLAVRERTARKNTNAALADALEAEQDADTARKESDALRIVAVDEKKRADEKADEARLNLYAADMLTVGQYLVNGNLGAARTILANHNPRAGEEDLRGWEWRYFRGQAKGEQLFRLGPHKLTVGRVELSANGERLLARCATEVVLWNTTTRKREHTWKILRPKGSSFSHDATRVALLRQNGRIELWDTDTREMIRECRENADSMLMSPTKDFAFLQISSKLLKWHLSTNAVEVISDLGENFSFAGIASDGTQLCLNTKKRLLIWSEPDQQIVRRISHPFGRKAGAVAVLPNQQGLLATLGLFQTPAYFSFADSTWTQPFPANTAGTYRLVVTDDGKHIVSCSFDHAVSLWTIPDFRLVHRYVGHDDEVFSVAVSKNGKWIASGSQDRFVHVWDRSIFREQNEIVGLVGPAPPVFSGDGRWVALSMKPKIPEAILSGPAFKTTIFDTTSLKRKRTLVGTPFHFVDSSTNNQLITTKLMPAPAGKLVVPNELLGWNSQWQEESLSLDVGDAKGLGYGVDGNWLAVAYDDGFLRLFDLADRAALIGRFRVGIERESSNTPFVPIAVNMRAGLVAVSGRTVTAKVRTIKVINVNDGNGSIVELEHDHQKSVCDLQWTRDASQLISCSFFNDMYVWDADTWKVAQVLKGHRRGISACDLSPDGKTLATASHDGTIKLWHLATGRELLTLDFHLAYQLSFSPDGQHLGAVSFDFTAPPGQMISRKEKFRIWHAPK